jgi:hypothetical protein
MDFLPYLRKRWHLPVLHVVVILAIAAVFATYKEPAFLGAYLLLLGELAAGVLVFRSSERSNRVGHLIVVVVVMAGTFAVLVSLSTCDSAFLAEENGCSPSVYWHALRALSGNFLLASFFVTVTVPAQYLFTLCIIPCFSSRR